MYAVRQRASLPGVKGSLSCGLLHHRPGPGASATLLQSPVLRFYGALSDSELQGHVDQVGIEPTPEGFRWCGI